MKLPIIERLFCPGSKLAAHTKRENYFFKSGFFDDDTYRCLDFFADNKDKIIAGMNKRIEETTGTI